MNPKYFTKGIQAMKNRKILIITVLIISAVLTLCSCGKSGKEEPTKEPAVVTDEPQQNPTENPTPTQEPTAQPTEVPTQIPTEKPTEEPTPVPTEVPPTKAPDSEIDPAVFAEKFGGDWTEITEHSEYIYFFYFDETEPLSVMFCHWNVAEYVQAAQITKIQQDNEGTYKLHISAKEADYYDYDEDKDEDVLVHVDGYEKDCTLIYSVENEIEYITVQFESENAKKYDRSGNPVYKTDDFHEVMNMSEEDAYNAICDFHGLSLEEKWAEYLVEEESGELTKVYMDPDTGVKMVCEYADTYILWNLYFVQPDEDEFTPFDFAVLFGGEWISETGNEEIYIRYDDVDEYPEIDFRIEENGESFRSRPLAYIMSAESGQDGIYILNIGFESGTCYKLNPATGKYEETNVDSYIAYCVLDCYSNDDDALCLAWTFENEEPTVYIYQAGEMNFSFLEICEMDRMEAIYLVLGASKFYLTNEWYEYLVSEEDTVAIFRDPDSGRTLTCYFTEDSYELIDIEFSF